MLVLTDERNYEDIAEALRDVTDTDDAYLPEEMATVIRRACASVRPMVTTSSMGDVSRSASASTAKVMEHVTTSAFDPRSIASTQSAEEE